MSVMAHDTTGAALPTPAVDPFVVQSVPCTHPYVAAVRSALCDDPVEFRPDPPVPGAPAGQWWPHPCLDPAWPSAAGDVDVVHVQFGFEGRTSADLAAWVDELRTHGIGLVLTVHDLVDPHAADDARYADNLDVLVRGADALTTLTDGAAREVAARFGRSPLVHPHPAIVDPSWADAPRGERASWTVSVHLKSLRANVDLDVVEALVAVVGDLGGATLRLHAHPEVLDASDPRHSPRLAALFAAPPAWVDTRVHPPLSDVDLWADVLDADLSVLPYSRSTHSGWLEMCTSLGTPVLAPDLGHLTDQRPLHTWVGGDLDSLGAAVRAAYARHAAGERPDRPDAHRRAADAAAVAQAHRRAYAAARARVTARAATPDGRRR